MGKLIVALAWMLLVISLPGCGVETDSEAETRPEEIIKPDRVDEQAVAIDGKTYTCAEALDVFRCEPIFQKAFDKWGSNLDDYVNSGRLGPYGYKSELSVKTTLGIAACALGGKGKDEDDFITYAQQFHDEDGYMLSPFWVEADYSLCPEAIKTYRVK